MLEQPNAEGWSLKDIVAHLVDVEDVAFVERISRMLGEDRPFIASLTRRRAWPRAATRGGPSTICSTNSNGRREPT